MYRVGLPILILSFAALLAWTVVRAVKRMNAARQPRQAPALPFSVETLDGMLQAGQITAEEHRRLTTDAMAKNPAADAPLKGPRGFEVLPPQQQEH